CCGMAGAFGYGADTYSASMEMAELSLLPAVRSAAANAIVVADGTSCRHQIRDGARREAVHVARVLAMSLDSAKSRTTSATAKEKLDGWTHARRRPQDPRCRPCQGGREEIQAACHHHPRCARRRQSNRRAG